MKDNIVNVLIIGENTKMAYIFSQIPCNIFILTDKSNNHYRNYDELSQYEIIELDNYVCLSKINNIHLLRNILKHKNIDIVFTNETKSMLISYLSTRFIKIKKPLLISTSHNSHTWNNRNKTFLYSLLIKMCTNGFISLGSFVTTILINHGVDKKKIFTTSNAIEPNIFKRKLNYEINSKKPKIVYVGVQYAEKGQFTLIESIRILKEKGIDATLTLIGDIIDPIYHKSNIDYITRHSLNNNIIYLGRIENSILRNVIKDYDIYVCPSYMEMSPYNILEAKSAGMPIIATNVGGIPEIITNYEDGILINAKSVSELSESITNLVTNNNLRRKIGEKAYLNSITKYSPLNISNKLKVYIESII